MRRSETWLTLAILGGFMAMTLWLLARGSAEQEQFFPPFTTLSPRPDGTLALYELAQSVGLDPQRWRGSEYLYPPQSTMVLIEPGFGAAIMPQFLDATALRLWMEEGGTLLLAGDGMALTVIPELLRDELELLAAEWPEVPESRTATQVAQGNTGRLTPLTRAQSRPYTYALPNDRPPLWSGVEQIEVGMAGGMQHAAMAVLLATSDGANLQPVLLHAEVGAGRLLWLTRPELLTNDWLAREDNHRLALATLQLAAADGALYFDEHVHGYSRAAPGTLAMLTRTTGGRLLLALAVLALLLFADSAVRSAKVHPEPTPPRRQAAEMVLAQASLYRRAGARNVIADGQVDGLRRAYMQALHLAHPPGDAELLAWVEAAPSLPGRAALADYLRDRLLPRSAHALLELTRAADAARAALERR